MTSLNFTITLNKISFLIAGGNRPGISLNLVDATTKAILKTATGNDNETMLRVVWDTTALIGKNVYIEALDF